MIKDEIGSLVTVMSKKVLPLGFGMAAYGAGPNQDPITRFFPSRKDDFKKEVELTVQAIRMGCRILDTAEAYGDSELILGEAIKQVDRSSLVIGTKIGIRFVPEVTIEDELYTAVEGSVRRLGTVPDVLYIHDRWDGHMEEEMDAALSTLRTLVTSGRAHSIGISNFRPEELNHAIDILGDSVQFYQAKLNVVNPRKDAAQTLRICKERRITFMASAALDRGGVLSNSSNIISDLAIKYSAAPAQIGILAVRALHAIPIVQTHNESHIRENIEALALQITPEDTEILRKLVLPPTV